MYHICEGEATLDGLGS